jgi:glucose/arabinose dehydrogenase
MRRGVYLLSLIAFLLAGCAGSNTSTSTPTTPTTLATATPTPATSSIAGLKLPAGFQISAYASGLNTPRFITIGPKGVLLVAERGSGSIIAFPAGTTPDKAGKPLVIASKLNSPSSLVMHDGYLYVGEGASIARMALGDDLKAGPITRIITDLPEGGQHSTRTVLIGPDNHIYVSIGSDCNVCIETDAHRAAIWVYNLDGSNGRLYARGLRNAVGMAINPWSQDIWVDVNGRDMMGDNTPPETVYKLIDQGDYGWPRCHAGNIPDPQFGQTPDACKGVQNPLVNMQAHSAPLGMAFYPPGATMFPKSYQNSLYIAFHGSWNRSEPTGDKVVRIPLVNGQVAGPPEDFISGWMKDRDFTSRPVGLVFAQDGSLFISDDNKGMIFHVWYQG